jgi:hypothetical protein
MKHVKIVDGKIWIKYGLHMMKQIVITNFSTFNFMKLNIYSVLS